MHIFGLVNFNTFLGLLLAHVLILLLYPTNFTNDCFFFNFSVLIIL